MSALSGHFFCPKSFRKKKQTQSSLFFYILLRVFMLLLKHLLKRRLLDQSMGLVDSLEHLPPHLVLFGKSVSQQVDFYLLPKVVSE